MSDTIKMIIPGLTDGHVNNVIEVLHDLMKYHEELTEFEVCAEIRDLIKELGHYRLGYIDLTERIMEILWDVHREHGVLIYSEDNSDVPLYEFNYPNVDGLGQVLTEIEDHVYMVGYDLEGIPMWFIFDLSAMKLKNNEKPI